MPRFIAPLRLALAILLTTVAAGIQAAPLQVVTSFSILGDLAQQVGGERVQVHALVGPDADAHNWRPRPSDARLVLQADVVLANGLGFDQWMERLAISAGGRPVTIVSEGITALDLSEHHAHDGHDHGPLDPHAWQDVANARLYARNIARALSKADPDGAASYQAGLERFDAELAALDAEIRQQLGALPEEARKVVTSHDAFGYFENAYGVRFLAAVSSAARAEASAATMARLIRQLRREKVPVAFIENVSDPRLIERISREGGARVGGRLYSDALSGPDGPAPTYTAMMRHNLDMLLNGLTP